MATARPQDDPNADGVHTPSAADQLQDWLQRLGQFDLVHCRMYHEKIARGPDGLTPLLQDYVESGFQRVEFCPFDVRAKRLACAHTPARIELRKLLAELPPGLCDPGQLAQWQAELRRLDLAIITVDQRKSSAEVAHARLSAGDAADREALAAQDAEIRQLEEQHSALVDELSALLADITAALAAARSRL